LPILERWLEHHQDIQDTAIAPQRELINREILANKSAATNIQKVLRGYKGRQQARQRTQAEQQEIEDAEREASKIREIATEQRKAKQAATNIQKVMRGYKGRREYDKTIANIVDLEMEQQMQNLSDELEELSIAPTSLEELDNIKKEQAKLRKLRSDKGVKRNPYYTKKLKAIDAAIESVKQKRADKLVEMSMQAAAAREPISPSSQVIQKLPNPVGRPRKKRNPVGRPPKGKDKDTQGAAGAGLKRVKPPKRQIRTNQEELMKNRLRLVASQIEAGNTNPRLIKEVNELYKKLYDIDNAYMLLKNKL
jgi:myosin heavy subunit